MRLVGIIILVFMVSMLGGWFGFRVALKDWNETRFSSISMEAAPETGALESGSESEITGLLERIEALENQLGERNSAENRNTSEIVSPTAKWTPEEKARLEKRSEQKTIELTDLEGRNIRVEILEVSLEQLSILRIADRRRFTLPVDRLIESDREFVDYLVNRDGATQDVALPAGDFDWDAVFGQME